MQFFGKTIENVRKHRNIKLVITERRRNKLLYYKVIHRKFIRNRNEKNSNVNEWACLFRFINIRSKCNGNVWVLVWLWWLCKTKICYCENAKRCYTDTDSFIVHVKTDDIYKDVITTYMIWYSVWRLGDVSSAIRIIPALQVT